MTILIQKDRKFDPGDEMTHPHQPTKGWNIPHQLRKLAYFVALKAYDRLFAPPLLADQMHDPSSRFIDSTLNRRGKLFTEDNVVTYIGFLKKKYPDNSILFLPDGLGRNKRIEGIDPLFVIGGGKRRGIEMEEKGEWALLNEEETHQIPGGKEKLIVYPFVYPAVGLFSLPHIVLLIVDKPGSTLWYYDSQGLTSDDPSRLKLFEDDPDFNMHENLVQLGKLFFPNQVVKIVENLSPHQIDPLNCGPLICRVLKRLYEGKSVEEALIFNPLVDSPLGFKKEAGHAYVESIAQIPIYDTDCLAQSRGPDRAAP